MTLPVARYSAGVHLARQNSADVEGGSLWREGGGGDAGDDLGDVVIDGAGRLPLFTIGGSQIGGQRMMAAPRSLADDVYECTLPL